MKFIDFFAGTGGMRRAFVGAGHRPVGWVEWDKYARISYLANFPEAINEWNAGDIRAVSADEIPKADIWAFGFPCQDLSRAKNERDGLNGSRSGMFWEVMRLAKDTLNKPKILFAENVKGVLDEIEAIKEAFAASGYLRTEYEVINAADHGVPQARERTYIVGYSGGRSRRKVFSFPQTTTGKLKIAGVLDMKTLDMNKRVYRFDGICPTLMTAQGGHRQPKILLPDGRIRKLIPLECFRVQGFPDEHYHNCKRAGLSDSQLYKLAGNSIAVPVVQLIAERL